MRASSGSEHAKRHLPGSGLGTSVLTNWASPNAIFIRFHERLAFALRPTGNNDLRFRFGQLQGSDSADIPTAQAASFHELFVDTPMRTLDRNC